MIVYIYIYTHIYIKLRELREPYVGYQTWQSSASARSRTPWGGSAAPWRRPDVRVAGPSRCSKASCSTVARSML